MEIPVLDTSSSATASSSASANGDTYNRKPLKTEPVLHAIIDINYRLSSRKRGQLSLRWTFMIGYFSGTGNSLYAAKKLAELTGDRALSLADIMSQPEHLPHRRFGIVFPVYFGDVPEPVRDLSPRHPSIRGPISLASRPAAEREGGPFGPCPDCFKKGAATWPTADPAHDRQQHRRLAPPY